MLMNYCCKFNNSVASLTFALVLALSASCKTTHQNRILSDNQTSSADAVNLSDPNSRVDAILTLAEREPRLPVGPNGFPRDPWQVMDLMELLYSQIKKGLHPSNAFKRPYPSWRIYS